MEKIKGEWRNYKDICTPAHLFLCHTAVSAALCVVLNNPCLTPALTAVARSTVVRFITVRDVSSTCLRRTSAFTFQNVTYSFDTLACPNIALLTGFDIDCPDHFFCAF